MDVLIKVALLVSSFHGVCGLTLTFAVDNSIEVWVDGTSQGTLDGWHNPSTVTLPNNAGVLSFQASNSGGPAGVLASLTNGMITNSEWRCTNSAPSGTAWRSGGFDDSGWEVATEYGVNGVSPWGLITDVAAGARWIWTSDNNVVGNVYCRIRIGVEVLATCDNTIWVYADGIDYTTTSTSDSNTDWPTSEYYILPRGTEVFGIKCTNAGGHAGILASVYNGPVTDEDHWKCTHTPGDGWSTLTYDDSDWEIPTLVGDHGDSPWGNLQNPYPISLEADWIWTSSDVTDIVNYPTVYCRVSIETPVTCWDHYTDRNAVMDLIPSARQQSRPDTFYFGDMDEAQLCADACARESNCQAYTFYLSSYSETWAGQCYGRSDYNDTLANDNAVDTGVKVSCADIPETGETITACTGLPNGNYQSTANCNEYITCLDGEMTSQNCPENQYWDDELERCDFVTSTCTDACSVGPCLHGGTCVYTGDSYTCTCPENVQGDNCETVTIPTGQCVSDCSGVADGDYQSCHSCSVYASCDNGALTDDIACDGANVWDDETGSCVAESTTCQDYCSVDSRSQCSTDGDGQTNCEFLGCCWDTTTTPNCYHSSESAVNSDSGVSCVSEADDRTDCGYRGIGREECLGYGCCWHTANDTSPWCFYVPVGTGETVTSCRGLADGDYQSPTNCNDYVRCSDGSLETLSCSEGEFWDDESGACAESTSTCSDACTATPCENNGICGYDGDSYTCTCVDGYQGTNCECEESGCTQTTTEGGGNGGSASNQQGEDNSSGFNAQNQKTLIPITIGSVVAALIIAGIIFAVIRRRRKKKQEEQEQAQKAAEEAAAEDEGQTGSDFEETEGLPTSRSPAETTSSGTRPAKLAAVKKAF